ncbi:MAG: transposase [bacterium LCO1.1]|uniref:Transposase n=1 Tax=Candidatus Weimeria bifida TaxID=2599074 RepID=A0A6N7IYV8_9FIRM|nr:transposase [Candidatus Weimeria bifida]
MSGARNGEVIQDYLEGYKGILVTDGYQPYHTIMKNSNDITVAGCYSHVRRKFAEIVKAAKAKADTGTRDSRRAVKRIDQFYHLDNKFKIF